MTDVGSALQDERLLSVRSLCKDFPGLRALDDVSLDVSSGEIVAILGHNGSGKSTLVKVLAGVYRSDAGTVAVGDGSGNTEIHFIHQDLGLIAELNAVENLEILRTGGVRSLLPTRRAAEAEDTRRRLSRFGSSFDVSQPVGSLSAAQRAIIAIARALDGWSHDKHVLVLDEPTEALHKSEVDILFSAIRGIAGRGAGVIFISHRLDEVLDLADRIIVLRDGQKVFDAPRSEVDESALISLITGDAPPRAERPSDQSFDTRADALLEVKDLRGQVLQGVDLHVHAGEIVGVAGVLGSGREEVPAVLFGAQPGSAERLLIAGQQRTLDGPRSSIQAGVAFVPGDRARIGSVVQLSARENVTLPWLRPLRGAFASLNSRQERREVSRLMASFGVRPARPEQQFGSFSGGNQQKLVLSKWLRMKPKVLLMEEPTQGVDVGATSAIYDAVFQAASEGTAVLVCSSDAKELAMLCSRVYVLRDGRVAAVLTGSSLTEQALIREGYGVGQARSGGLFDGSAQMDDVIPGGNA